jgi:hypothetical protein
VFSRFATLLSPSLLPTNHRIKSDSGMRSALIHDRDLMNSGGFLNTLKLIFALFGILSIAGFSTASATPPRIANRYLASIPRSHPLKRPSAPQPAQALTLNNFVSFVRMQVRETSESHIKMVKSSLEKKIIRSLTENPNVFLRQLTNPATTSLLAQNDGIAILQRIDNLMTNAVQDLGEQAHRELHLKNRKGRGVALERIARIRVIEKKRDDLAAQVAAQRTEMNFNSVFDYMVQAHFRRADGLNQGQDLPKDVKYHLYGRSNPNQTAFQTLKQMTISVLACEKSGPLQILRQLKVAGTAELTPPFKPTLQAWTLEASNRRQFNYRSPSSTLD